MGTSRLNIDDERASFSCEIENGSSPMRQWHFSLSTNGANKLIDSLRYAESRQKATSIVIPCQIPDIERTNAKDLFSWFSCLIITVGAANASGETTFSELEKSARLNIRRTDVVHLYKVAALMSRGTDDVAVPMGASDNLWVWGSGRVI